MVTQTAPLSVKTVSPTRDAGTRLASLDVFRGLCVAGMILVTDPGTYSAVYPQLLHAQWFGATATDMIFPSFLFIVGVAITLSFASRRNKGASRGLLAAHVARRAALIFLAGLAVNGFPDYRWQTLRIPGVLQRIALCYAAAALLYLVTDRESEKKQNVVLASVTVALLGVYWALLKLVPVPGYGAGYLDSVRNLPAYVDRQVFTTAHLWPWGLTPGYGVTYDPEGILSTLPAIANVLIGILAGKWLRTGSSPWRKVAGMAAAGALLVITGLLLDPLMPLNKRIWTSTFTLFSSGVSLMVFAACYAVLDIWRARRWSMPLRVLGTNAILAFALSGVITTATDRIHAITDLTLHQWGNLQFAKLLAPVHASLAYAIAIVVLNILLVYPLYRKKIFLRV